LVEVKQDNPQNNTPRTVTDIMSPSLVTMSSRDNIFEIAKKMKNCRITAIFLTDDQKAHDDRSSIDASHIVGIITQTDLVEEICARNAVAEVVTAESIMSPIITINSQAKIEEAARLMNEKRIRHLAVCHPDNPNQILGIITGSDLSKYLKSKLIHQNKEGLANLTEELTIADALAMPDELPSENQDIEC
jgi:CBS domain-containing protein